MATYHVLVECIFCDYEKDLAIRARYFDRWMFALQSLVNLRVPDNVRFTYIMYVSDDKGVEIEKLNIFLNTLDPVWKSRILLVKYSHPEEGYGYESENHADLRINPNKTGPYRDRLFQHALDSTGLHVSADRVIRMSIDDDDIWLPWQLEEIVKFAELGYEPDRIVVVGLRNLGVAYLADGYVDIVEFLWHMNGNKFYLAPKDMFLKLKRFSPWSIPERRGEPSIQRMGRYGIPIKTTDSNLPGFLYCRWGENITKSTKRHHYQQNYFAFEVPDIAGLLEESMKNIRADRIYGLDTLKLPGQDA